MDNKDYSSIYSIKDFFLNDIASKYFNISDVSLMNVGLLGMNLDIAASVTEDIFMSMSRYLIESMPTKARLPEFIYSNAANYGIDSLFATCSQMPLYLYVKEEDILNYGKKVDNHQEFVLDSDLVIYVEDIPFSIPYNIVIRSNEYKGEWNHQVNYDMSFKNTATPITSPYIKSMKIYANGDMYIALSVIVYQYKKSKHHENIINNNKLNIPSIEIEIEDSICNFEIFYSGNSTKRENIQLLKYVETTPPTPKPFVYYKFKDENTIRFSFANSDRYFIPEYNSDINIELFHTMGEKGSFEQYTGNNVYVTTSSEVEEYSYNNAITLFATPKGDSINGKNALTLEDIRRLTVERMITVNSYTTDNDINLYYLNYAYVHDTKAKFIKKRDDYIREYYCYTLLQNSTDIFPTNTLDAEIKTGNIDKIINSSNKYIINAGCKFGYLDGNLTTARLYSRDTPDEDIGDFIYTSVALISISANPNNVAYYINSVNKSIVVDYTYLNQNSIVQFIVSNFSIYRNAVIGDTSYDITLSIYSSNGTSEQKIIPSNITVLLYFNTQEGHYIEMNYVETTENDVFIYKTKIETDDTIDSNRISITNLLPKGDDHIPETKMLDMENTPIKILVFYDNGILEDQTHEYKSIPKVKNSTLTNIYKPVENEFHLAYPLSLMKSTLKFLPDNQEQFYFYVKDIPMFKRDFVLDENNLKMVLKKIESQHTFIFDSLEKIISNFSVVIKFYNTFGKSKMFVLSNGELLNKTNCNIRLAIKFNSGVIVEDYIPIIKRYIKNYIESINKNSGINKILISELITALHNNFEQISYIIFKSINDYPSDIQAIQMTDMSDDDFNLRPEFLTISENDVEILIIE